MKHRTSNTIFLSSILAGIAVCAVMASPAYAQESVESETVCMDDMCYEVTETPIVELDMSDIPLAVTPSDIIVDRNRSVQDTVSLSFETDTSVDNMVTVLGRVGAETSVRTDEYLSHDVSQPSNLDLAPNGQAAGLGLRSTF